MPSLWRRLCCGVCCIDEEEVQPPPSPAQAKPHSQSRRDGLTREHRVDIRSSDSPDHELQAMLPPTTDGRVAAASSSSSLSAAQLSRARDLASWSSLDLGWRVLLDPDPSHAVKAFYFNVWTGRTVWQPTASVRAKRTLENQRTDLQIPGSLVWIRTAVERMADMGIELRLWSNEPQDARHQSEFLRAHRIAGRTPNLLHVLFYAHVLVNEFAIYPRAFIRALGLRRIVLADGLTYERQARNAIPLVETGTLLFDPKLEDIVYVASVLHHEFFHIIDCAMIWRSENHANKRLQQQQHQDDDDNFDEEEDFETREFDFDTPIEPREQGEPLPPYALDACASLHSVPDVRWSRMNPLGFRYGAGGAASRGHHLFLSLGQQTTSDGATHPPVRGFVNGYSQTAVEEDKAETYAALIRDASSLLHGEDAIVRAKARELMARLAWFCSEFDDVFWTRLQTEHTLHPARPNLREAPHGSWVERVDHAGHRYFFNTTTLQTSWVKPHTLAQQQTISVTPT